MATVGEETYVVRDRMAIYSDCASRTKNVQKQTLNMVVKNVVAATFLFILPMAASSQEFSKVDISSLQGVLKMFLDSKVKKAEEKIRKNSIDVVHRFKETEEDMIASMAKRDSSLREMESKICEFYTVQEEKLNQTGQGHFKSRHYYTPLLDSIQCLLRFLNTEIELKAISTRETSNLLTEFDEVQANLDQVTALEKILIGRIDQIVESYPKDLIDKYTKRLRKLSSEYSTNIQKLKKLYETPGKVMSRVFSRFSRSEKFQEFMSKNSIMAEFFRMPVNGTRLEPEAIAGLQTRKLVEQLMASQLGMPGVNIDQQVSHLFHRTESTMPQNDMDSLNVSGKRVENEIKRKELKREVSGKQSKIGFGFNFQTTGYNGIFPVTVDFGGQVNYRISDKFYTGVGVSYKLGLGNNFQSFKLTHEGVGLRSGLDFNIKKSFFISGGFEVNYFKRITDFDQLKDLSQWQNSALLGAMQKVRIGRASSTIQLMFDFLHNKHVPRTQPVLFRFGYQF
jgi:hypothetical protein